MLEDRKDHKNARPWRLLFCDFAGSRNRGCQAIVRTFAEGLDNALGDIDLAVVASSPESESAYPGGMGDATLIERYRPRWSLQRIAASLARRMGDEYRAIRLRHGHLRKWLAWADATFSVGGDEISMTYGGPWHTLEPLAMAKKRGKLAIIEAASIGPFPDDEVYRYVQGRLKMMDLICARETITRDYLEAMGLENVAFVADPAFLMEPETVPDEQCPPPGPCVGIGLSAGMAKYLGLSTEAILDASASLVRALVASDEFHVGLLPHVFTLEESKDDFWFCQEVARRAGHNGNVWTLPRREVSARHLKCIIGKFDVFAGCRTHSTIASYSLCVPTLPFTYSIKSKGMAQDVYGHQDYVLELDGSQQDRNVEAILDVFRRREQVAEEMREGVESLKARAQHNIDACVGVLRASQGAQ
jgi:polysaccharide pyruvyl transferase WcaK-like protein